MSETRGAHYPGFDFGQAPVSQQPHCVVSELKRAIARQVYESDRQNRPSRPEAHASSKEVLVGRLDVEFSG